MKKAYLFFSLITLSAQVAFAQPQIITTGNNVIDTSNPTAADIVIGSSANGGTRHDGSIMWWSNTSASRISNSGDIFYFSNWNTSNANVSLNATPGGNSYFQGSVGIRNTSPQSELDLSGSMQLRNYSNYTGAGSSISFSSYGALSEHPGSRIRNYLEYAAGPAQSASRLILSSYFGGYKDEVTLYNGHVGINMINPNYDLDVNGQIHAKAVLVNTTGFPDFVFDKTYKLKSLKEVELYIERNHHLSELPSQQQAIKEGMDIGEMNKLLLKKVEELTLYIIEQDKINRHQQDDILRLNNKVKILANTISINGIVK